MNILSTLYVAAQAIARRSPFSVAAAPELPGYMQVGQNQPNTGSGSSAPFVNPGNPFAGQGPAPWQSGYQAPSTQNTINTSSQDSIQPQTETVTTIPPVIEQTVTTPFSTHTQAAAGTTMAQTGSVQVDGQYINAGPGLFESFMNGVYSKIVYDAAALTFTRRGHGLSGDGEFNFAAGTSQYEHYKSMADSQYQIHLNKYGRGSHITRTGVLVTVE